MLDKYDKKAFGNWLILQLRQRDMTQSDLADKAGLSRQGISGVVTGFRRPGTQICLSISKAMNIPPEEVLAAAGILPKHKTSSLDRLNYMVSLLPDQDQSDVMDYIELKIKQREKKNNDTKEKMGEVE